MKQGGNVALLWHFTSSGVWFLDLELFFVVLVALKGMDPWVTNTMQKKLSPKITLHLKWSVKVEHRYPKSLKCT